MAKKVKPQIWAWWNNQTGSFGKASSRDEVPELAEKMLFDDDYAADDFLQAWVFSRMKRR